jgi:hypothetical protein
LVIYLFSIRKKSLKLKAPSVKISRSEEVSEVKIQSVKKLRYGDLCGITYQTADFFRDFSGIF